jgi:hypothetical protein
MRGLSFRNCVPQSRVSCQPLFVHTNQHWDGYIGVVVNLDFGFVLVEAMQAHVLLKRTFIELVPNKPKLPASDFLGAK